ncbi:signal peptidase I [Alkalihalobacillus sp. LMS6]|uniref:signal peptidase I n=1 Tax=Alkalihalobacillus sp. LMS6 TaxID=2924034 RepID=UPI0020D0FD5C|nr:signal peptidase I [Alkalihalobacillus sp. LMS6]UTR05777.1 signal peptidase I [Alkalihalobacillus sp. LMS6]
MAKKIWTSIRLVLMTIFSFLFFVVLLVFMQSNGEEGAGIELFGYTSFTVLSNSMEPTFHAGDVIIIEQNEDVRNGDVVTYMTPERRLFTHRIVGEAREDGKTFYTTKGDNNSIEDRLPIVDEQIVGVHRFTIPKIGLISESIQNNVDMRYVVFIPLVIFLIITIMEFTQKKHKKPEEEQLYEKEST